MSNGYNYSIVFKKEKKTPKTVVFKLSSENNKEINTIEFPVSDIDTVIDTLYKSKKELINLTGHPDFYTEDINPIILDTLVELFFSGISIPDLSTQYGLPEQLIKNNLEKKGIMIFDEF